MGADAETIDESAYRRAGGRASRRPQDPLCKVGFLLWDPSPLFSASDPYSRKDGRSRCAGKKSQPEAMRTRL